MVSPNEFQAKMSQRPKMRVSVGEKGKLSKLNFASLPGKMKERIKMPFTGDKVEVKTEEGKSYTVDNEGYLKEGKLKKEKSVVKTKKKVKTSFNKKKVK